MSGGKVSGGKMSGGKVSYIPHDLTFASMHKNIRPKKNIVY